MGRCLKHRTYEARLKDPSLFSLEKKKPEGNLTFNNFMMVIEKVDRLFSEIHSERIRDNTHNL